MNINVVAIIRLECNKNNNHFTLFKEYDNRQTVTIDSKLATVTGIIIHPNHTDPVVGIM